MISDAFITRHNFREYMTDAMNICIASAYFSKNMIEIIKADLNRLPQKGGRNFKILLDHEFNPDSNLRKVLINMLLELPNVEVRVYQGKKFFHPKLYIFENGNNMFMAVGSFNATAGGGGQHIEAGVCLTDREIYQQAKDFFNTYWDSQDTEIAKYEKEAFYSERKFKYGDGVIILHSGEKGVIYNTEPVIQNKEWIYDVFVADRIKKIGETGLKTLEIIDVSDQNAFIELGEPVKYSEWLRNYILEKAIDLTSNTISSYESSRTETYEYQFKPLFKLLNNGNHRLLIADEVGLGKTIEAGIILKELSVRGGMQNVLIIVPNALKTKWRDELRIRFQEYYDIVSAQDLALFIQDYRRSPMSVGMRAIITYNQITSQAVQAAINNEGLLPEFDLIILDEVHHLKNCNTIVHKVIKKLTQRTGAMIMLSATPIQLGSFELYNILNILLPGIFSDGSTRFSAHLTLCERVNKAIQLLKTNKYGEFVEVIREISEKRAFKQHLLFVKNVDAILDRCFNADQLTKDEIKELSDSLSTFNILYQYINRTLRKDVALKFADRNIQTIEYEYNQEEIDVYQKILEFCRSKSDMEGSISAFSHIMPERRAASSLQAMVKSIKTKNWGVWNDDNQNASDEADD